MTATAGKVLTEAELRAYMKCSQFYSFGGKVKTSVDTQMAQHMVEYWLSAKMDNPKRDNAKTITFAVERAAQRVGLRNLLPGDEDRTRDRAALWFDQFLRKFPEKKFKIVSGPLPWRLKISKTVIEVRISGVLRNVRNKTLHVLTFTPYRIHHSQINDPISYIKAYAVKEFVPKHHARPQSVVHIMWAADKSGAMRLSTIDDQQATATYMRRVKQLIRRMEEDMIFPLVPCLYSCPYKEKCKPSTE